MAVAEDPGGVSTVAQLEAVIGRTPPAIQLKVIDHLDETALRWLARSPLMFGGWSDGGQPSISAAGGEPGFATGDPRTLRVPLEALDDAAAARPGAGFGSLFLVPGIGETLRVNGRVRTVAAGEMLVDVEECYVHCAKALIRSAFWSAAPQEPAPADPAAMVAASRFLALATSDAAGRTDVSPKGDPAGRMALLADGGLCFADRPGNRRADGFRNILVQPRLAALLLLPGSTHLLRVTGTAHLTTDAAALAAFEVNGKVPILATRLADMRLEPIASAALRRARLWPTPPAATDLQPAKMLVAHMKLNKDKGLAAHLAGAIVSIPGLLQKGLEKDYKTNLY